MEHSCENCFYEAISVVIGGEKMYPPACADCFNGKEYTKWLWNRKDDDE